MATAACLAARHKTKNNLDAQSEMVHSGLNINQEIRIGTLIHMEITNNSQKTMEQTFNQFSDSGDRGFYRTRFLLSLAALEVQLGVKIPSQACRRSI